MADEKIIPSDDYRVKVATVVDMADKWFRQADGGELDKYDEIELLDACKSVLKFHGLTVVDPAKCMVLERREWPTDPGVYIAIERTPKSASSIEIHGVGCIEDLVNNCHYKSLEEWKEQMAFDDEAVFFGPISLPTEAR